MGAEVHSALYGTRVRAGKRATLEQTLSTPSNRAFPPKVSHPKGFRNTIPDSPTALSSLWPTTQTVPKHLQRRPSALSL